MIANYDVHPREFRRGIQGRILGTFPRVILESLEWQKKILEGSLETFPKEISGRSLIGIPEGTREEISGGVLRGIQEDIREKYSTGEILGKNGKHS